MVAFDETQLNNTIIRAPITGTILERNVERASSSPPASSATAGAKGYVVSMADLNDLQVELDINQNDFAKLASQAERLVTTDAYPGPQVRRRHRRDLARSESPEGDRAGEGEGVEP